MIVCLRLRCLTKIKIAARKLAFNKKCVPVYNVFRPTLGTNIFNDFPSSVRRRAGISHKP